MLSHEQILRDVEEILTEKMGVELTEPINEDTNFLKDGLSLDSVVLLEMIIELELKYDIEIDEDELNVDIFTKAGNMADFLNEKMAKK